MTQINAKDVAALRQRTGLSMMECKKALVEAEGDHEQAEILLRKKLKGKMETRTDRAAGEGRIGIKAIGTDAAIAEVRAETDFTAKNENFSKTVDGILDQVLGGGGGAFEQNDTIKGLIDEIRISSGENCSYARGAKVAGGDGAVFGSYIHHDGKIGALVHASGDVSEETLRNVCMHICAVTPPPLGVSADEIPESVVEKERKIRVEQAVESGKPQEIAEKMVEGGMRKFFGEVALIEQPFVMDPSKSVRDIVGGGTIHAFYRWRVGEDA